MKLGRILQTSIRGYQKIKINTWHWNEETVIFQGEVRDFRHSYKCRIKRKIYKQKLLVVSLNRSTIIFQLNISKDKAEKLKKLLEKN